MRAGPQSASKGKRELERLALRHVAHVRLWFNLGNVQKNAGDLDAARKSYEHVLSRQPRHRGALLKRAEVEAERGGRDLPFYRTAVDRLPQEPAVHTAFSSALAREGRVAEAIEYLSQLTGQAPLWIEGQNLLAQFRWQSGEAEDFDRGFVQATSRHPGNLPLRTAHIAAVRRTRGHAASLPLIAAARQAFAGAQVPLDKMEAVARAETGDFSRARELFEATEDGQDVFQQIEHGRLDLRTGRYGEAAARFEALLGRGHDAHVWPYIATSWRLTGNPRHDWLEGADARFASVMDVADRLPDLAELAECLRSLHFMKSQPIEQSLRGGTQTMGHLFHRPEPELIALRRGISEAVSEYIGALPPIDDTHPLLRVPRRPPRFSGAWSVRLTGRGFHAAHYHDQGWLSSALYIALPGGLGGAQKDGWLTFGQPPAELDLPLEPLKSVEPRPGRLALFPSIMWHGTRPFAEGERLTVAFDTVPSP